MRNTRQAQTLRHVMRTHGAPLSVDEIWKQARSLEPALGMATVYRYVARWLATGWIELVEIPGQPPRYELAGKSHHHHFVCDNCGLVFDLPCALPDLASALPEGFHATKHELAIYGACRTCFNRKDTEHVIDS